MLRTRTGAFRRPIGVAIVCSAILLVGVGQGPAHAGVVVSGNAYGYFSSIGLFGGAPTARGLAPAVTLPPGGSAAPVTASAPMGIAQYGPAIVFTSGPITVSTRGKSGRRGSVTSGANVQTVNRSGEEVFTATNVASTCTASGAGVTRSAAITNGTLQTSDGNPNVTGDETVVPIPANPAPNTTYSGVLNSTGGDTFRYVFNEQIVKPDGSVAISAAHEYLLGPTAVGSLVIGQSACGARVDNRKPRLRSLKESPVSFRAAGKGKSITTRRVGARVSYRLSEPAAVRFRVERARLGRRVRGRCVKPRRSNLGARPCTRYPALRAGFTHQGKAGKNRFRFSGRLGGRKLRPGSYRLRAVATDLAGNKGRPKRSRRFLIVRF